mgnify:FL=1
MKTGKWKRILGASLTAAMLVGSMPAALAVNWLNDPIALRIHMSTDVEVKEEAVAGDPFFVDTNQDEVYYLTPNTTLTLSLNPEYGGEYWMPTLLDITTYVETGADVEKLWDQLFYVDYDGENTKDEYTLSPGIITDREGKTMEFGQPGHLYGLQAGMYWNKDDISSKTDYNMESDYWHVAYFYFPEDTTSGSGSTEIPEVPTTATANPTSAKVLVNSEAIAFDAYEINNNNYFKLRDIAKVLSGSEKQFEVTWDGAKNTISLISGQPYTAVGGELTAGSGTSQQAKLNTSAVVLDGETVSLTAYTINGNNYFKLRDLGAAFDFGIGWDGATNTVTIDTSTGYTPE